MRRLTKEEQDIKRHNELEKHFLEMETKFPDASRWRSEWREYVDKSDRGYCLERETVADYVVRGIRHGLANYEKKIDEMMVPRRIVIPYQIANGREALSLYELWDRTESAYKEECLREEGPFVFAYKWGQTTSRGRNLTADLLGRFGGDEYATAFIWLAAFGHDVADGSRAYLPEEWRGEPFIALEALSLVANRCVSRVLGYGEFSGSTWHHAMTGAFPGSCDIAELAGMGLRPRDWRDWCVLVGMGIRLIREKSELVHLDFVKMASS